MCTPEATNIAETVVTAWKIESQSVPGASRERPNEPSRAENREPERYRTAERIFFCQSSEQGATQSRTQPREEHMRAGAPENWYENSRMDELLSCGNPSGMTW